MIIQPGLNPSSVVSAATSGMDGLGVKVGAVSAMTIGSGAKTGTVVKAGSVVTKGSGAKAAMVGLGKTAGGGTFWSGTGWSLGMGLGLGAWGPVLMTVVGTIVIYKATPALVKVLAKR